MPQEKQVPEPQVPPSLTAGVVSLLKVSNIDVKSSVFLFLWTLVGDRYSLVFYFRYFTLPKFNSSPLKSYLPNKKGSLPTTIFQGLPLCPCCCFRFTGSHLDRTAKECLRTWTGRTIEVPRYADDADDPKVCCEIGGLNMHEIHWNSWFEGMLVFAKTTNGPQARYWCLSATAETAIGLPLCGVALSTSQNWKLLQTQVAQDGHDLYHHSPLIKINLLNVLFTCNSYYQVAFCNVLKIFLKALLERNQKAAFFFHMPRWATNGSANLPCRWVTQKSQTVSVWQLHEIEKVSCHFCGWFTSDFLFHCSFNWMICFQLVIGVVSFRAKRDCKVDQEIKQRVLCFRTEDGNLPLGRMPWLFKGIRYN